MARDGSASDRHERLWWMFGIAFTLHNLEEVAMRSHWAEAAGAFWSAEVSTDQFGLAVAVLTALVWMVVVWAVHSHRRSLALRVMGAMAGVLALNAVFPHLAVSVMTSAYSPGVVTALLLNAPICAAILRRSLVDDRIGAGQLLVSVAVAGVVVAMLVAASFAVARATM